MHFPRDQSAEVTVTGFRLFCACWLIPGTVLGDIARPDIQVLDSGKQGLISVESRQAPLSRVLDEIAGKTGVRIHYSVLPEGPVTATCAGDSVRSVVTCLLGSDANLVFRHADGNSRGKPTDVWVLGTSLADGRPSAKGHGCPTAAEAQHDAVHSQVRATAMGDAEPLVEMAQDTDSGRRIQAVSRLAAERGDDSVAVRAALENALSDEEAEVRAQAVYGMAKRGGAEAATVLQAALHDRDSSVRLMAVDSIAATDARSIDLLRQALSDHDETVSALAAMKLESAGNAGDAGSWQHK